MCLYLTCNNVCTSESVVVFLFLPRHIQLDRTDLRTWLSSWVCCQGFLSCACDWSYLLPFSQCFCPVSPSSPDRFTSSARLVTVNILPIDVFPWQPCLSLPFSFLSVLIVTIFLFIGFLSQTLFSLEVSSFASNKCRCQLNTQIELVICTIFARKRMIIFYEYDIVWKRKQKCS